jgi:hypothetical protein
MCRYIGRRADTEKKRSRQRDPPEPEAGPAPRCHIGLWPERSASLAHSRRRLVLLLQKQCSRMRSPSARLGKLATGVGCEWAGCRRETRCSQCHCCLDQLDRRRTLTASRWSHRRWTWVPAETREPLADWNRQSRKAIRTFEASRCRGTGVGWDPACRLEHPSKWLRSDMQEFVRPSNAGTRTARWVRWTNVLAE